MLLNEYRVGPITADASSWGNILISDDGNMRLMIHRMGKAIDVNYTVADDGSFAINVSPNQHNTVPPLTFIPTIDPGRGSLSGDFIAEPFGRSRSARFPIRIAKNGKRVSVLDNTNAASVYDIHYLPGERVFIFKASKQPDITELSGFYKTDRRGKGVKLLSFIEGNPGYQLSPADAKSIADVEHEFIQHLIYMNLRTIVSAGKQYHLENNSKTASYENVVRDGYFKPFQPLAGEVYNNLSVNYGGGVLRVTTNRGDVIEFQY